MGEKNNFEVESTKEKLFLDRTFIINNFQNKANWNH